MKKYRVKEYRSKFYPQYKSKFWNIWYYYRGNSYKDYGAFSLMNGEKYVTRYENLYFDTFEESNSFLIKQKNLDKITYYNIKD